MNVDSHASENQYKSVMSGKGKLPLFNSYGHFFSLHLYWLLLEVKQRDKELV